MEIQGIEPSNLNEVVAEMARIGAAPETFEPVVSRLLFRVLRVSGISPAAALSVKKELLAAGGDASLPASACRNNPPEKIDILVAGTLDAFRRCLSAIAAHSAELKETAEEIRRVLMLIEGSRAPQPVQWPNGPMKFGEKTIVMGIINFTPDSFYDGGRNNSLEKAVATVEEMIDSGADIIDIGGESSRPGAQQIPADEEIGRTTPLIKELRRVFPALRISIDTYKWKVAAAAIEAGAGMLNDISALRLDHELTRVAADTGVPVCLMHMKGTPADMQADPRYAIDVCYEINAFFSERIAAATAAGINESQIILDPGIGFGKTVGHNFDILSRLGEFRCHGRPLLVGASRKSFIGKTLGLDPEERLEGSLAAAVMAAARGADIIRVHDVRETVRAIRIADAALKSGRLPHGNKD